LHEQGRVDSPKPTTLGKSGLSRQLGEISRKGETMNTPTAADAIFNKLCEKFKRDGKDDWENVYALGEELGYSKDEVRDALRDFEKVDQRHVEIDHITREHVRLATPGKQACKSLA
jgi:hypothetical protein